MTQTQFDKKYLQQEQYKDAEAYEKRIALLQYGDQKLGIWEWQAQYYDFHGAKNILEVGCGPGSFWEYGAKKLTSQQHLLLTDLSPGMLDVARKNVTKFNLPADVEFQQADVENLNFPGHSFDVVLSHLMLYHAYSQTKALSEIKRVLKSDGWLGITTVQSRNNNPIFALAHAIDSRIPPYGVQEPFSAQKADQMLPEFFGKVKKYEYINNLHVTTAQPIVDYMKYHPSAQKLGLSEEFFREYKKQINDIIEKNKSFYSNFTVALYICSQR